METILERLDDLEDELAVRAFLYDHPAVYRAAVAVTMKAVRAMLGRASEARATALYAAPTAAVQ